MFALNAAVRFRPRALLAAGTVRRRRQWSDAERLLRKAFGPASAGASAYLLAAPQGRVGTTALVIFVVSFSHHVVARHEPSSVFVPLVRAIYPAVAPVLAFCALGFLKVTSVVAGLTAREVLLICAIAGLGSVLSRATLPLLSSPPRTLRIAVVGSRATADGLLTEIAAAGRVGFEVVGYVSADAEAPLSGGRARCLGGLSSLAAITESEKVNLVLVGSEAPRLTVFEELADACVRSHVRVLELSAFYEGVFGHVPLAAINAAWFQCVMHPRYSQRTPGSKRALDLVVASAALLVFAPMLLALAVAVKLTDGGPVFFKQVRIGEGGRPFSMLKLRSMRATPPGATHHWTIEDDDRITAVGRLMRRTHLDEMPQLINIVRGDMSVVGPRPEQPSYVERLETVIPHYTRRHSVRPGLTGWAQVNCGYAGSDEGTAWKLCHDLYYLKHRSLGLDILILAETVRTLVADRQFEGQPRMHGFVRPAGAAWGVDAAALLEGEPVAA